VKAVSCGAQDDACVLAACSVALAGLPPHGMSAVALIASVQASVAAALARGVSIDAIESRLAVCCSEMNMLTAGTKRNLLVGAAAEASPVPRRRPGAGEPRLSPVAMDNAPSAVTAGTAPQKQGSPGRRQQLPPSGLTPRNPAESGAGVSPDPARSPSTPSKSKLTPIAKAESLGASTSAPQLSVPSSSGKASAAQGALKTPKSAASLVVESSSLRKDLISVTHERCPLDEYTRRLDEFLRLGKSRTQLEKDQKGLGNPTMPSFNLPDFDEELRARAKRKMLLTSIL